MKNLRFVLVALMALTISFNFSSCKKAAEPKDVVSKWWDALIKKDVDKAFTYIYFEEGTEQEEIDALKAKYKGILEYTQGIKSYEIISEEISEDGKTATVKVKLVFGNGEENEDDVDLIKVDEGWKLKL